MRSSICAIRLLGLTALSCFLGVSSPLLGQADPAGKQGEAAAPKQQELTLEVALRQPNSITPRPLPHGFLPGTERFYLQLPDRLLVGDVQDPAVRLQVTLAQLVKQLEAHGVDTPPTRMPRVRWLPSARHPTLSTTISGSIYHWQPLPDDGELELAFADVGVADRSSLGPNERIGAFVIDHNLHIRRKTGERRQITWDGGPDIVYGGAAHRAEFGITDGLWWDGEGRRLAFSREDQRPIAPYPYIDYSVTPPVAKHGRYPMAGRPHAAVTIGIYDREDDSVRYLEHDPAIDQYWTNVTWSPDGRSVYVALVNRGQDRCELVRFDAATGERGPTLFVERDPQWVEPELGPIFAPDGQSFLWRSPRNGWAHLYRYGLDGTLHGQVTDGPFDVQEVFGFDPAGRRVYFAAAGKTALDRQLWSVDSTTGKREQHTHADGHHQPTVSDSKASMLDWSSSMDRAPGLRAVSTHDQTSARPLLQTRPEQQFVLPEQQAFTLKLDDTQGTLLHGHLLLPPNRQPDAKLPVLLYVYGGPHSQLVTNRWLGGAQAWLAAMAAQGYVVCRLDNRGTNQRGIEFAQSVHRRLSDLEVQDQLRAIEWLKQQPFVDPNRIAVHGWSYGGYMTLRLLEEAPPGTFRCGISGAPVTDWSQYETGYGERYMDTPAENPDGYRRASATANAAKLDTPLLLIHGTDDQTVMLSHAIGFLDASIDAGRFVECMWYPMQQHGIRGRDRAHLYRGMARWLAHQMRLPK